jgi:outer membrane protein assembly factor BamB
MTPRGPERTSRAGLALALAAAAAAAQAADWPQWRGADRNGVSTETGLLRAWPAGGPPLLWSVDRLGDGYSSAAIAAGRVYVTGSAAGQGLLTCSDTAGRVLWRKPYGAEGTRTGPYARSTPTVDRDRVFLMTAAGEVVCLEAAAGDRLWSVDTVERFGARQPEGGHGISENVLAVGDLVLCTPGGDRAAVAALDRATGRTIWALTNLVESSGFNQPLLVRRGGRDVVVVLTSLSLLGLDAREGRLLWRHAFPGRMGQCFTPICEGDLLYAPVGPGASGVGFRLAADAAVLVPAWDQPRMTCHHGGAVVVDGRLYGTHGHFRLACLDLRSGRMLYETPRRVGLAATLAADGMLYLGFEDGTVRLAPATPKGYEPCGEFTVPLGQGKLWAHPALSDGLLYIRRGDVLMAFDVRSRR